MSFGTTTPKLASQPTGAMSCHEHLSSPWDIEWESYKASVDVLQQKDIVAAASAAAPNPKEMQLPSICTAPGTKAPASPDFKIRTPDRFVVDLAEHRRGYSYSVQMETPDHWKATALEENCMTPRRVLDKENSDDFSSFAGLQEGPGTAALFSDYAGPVSSPFAAHMRQPFWDDNGSCRSRLSEYGYDTASDEEEEAEEQQLHAMASGQDAVQDAVRQQEQQQPPPKSPPPEERTGFWADVGAPGSKLAKGSADYDMPKQTDGGQLEMDDWEYGSGSDTNRKPDQDMECAMDTRPMDIHPHTPGVLLPWDMD